MADPIRNALLTARSMKPAAYAVGGRAKENDNTWWHGTASGNLKGGTAGLHLGTKAAAEDALHATIGYPAEGHWDGTREYGKTLLAGKKNIVKRNKHGITGHNVDAPEHDHYIHEHPSPPKFSNGESIPLDSKPFIKPYKITGKMTNSIHNPHSDWHANGYMKAALKKGNAKNGYYYKNEGEDSGSISAVVPNGSHVKEIERDGKASGGSVQPTQAQKEAGNYRKHHVKWAGLDIAIENPKGSMRSGANHQGKSWSVKMPAHYGYIKRTEGADGDHVDVYLGPDLNSHRVFIVNQHDHETDKFDEHKCMIGFPNFGDARRAYVAGFSDGKGNNRIGSIKELSVEQFKDWLKDEDKTKRIARQSGGAVIGAMA